MTPPLISQHALLAGIDFTDLAGDHVQALLLTRIEHANAECTQHVQAFRAARTAAGLAYPAALFAAVERREFLNGVREGLKLVRKARRMADSNLPALQSALARLENERARADRAEGEVARLRAEARSFGRRGREAGREVSRADHRAAAATQRHDQDVRELGQQIRQLKWQLLQALRDEHPQQVERRSRAVAAAPTPGARPASQEPA